jgi:hypothetical protein
MASARQEFPPVIKDFTTAPCEPRCILCHETNAPLPGDIPLTVAEGGRPFVNNLRALYSEPYFFVPANLRLALQAMRDLEVADPRADANANQTNDLDDITNGINPNDGSPLCIGPKYGCGASRIEPKGDLDDYGTFLAAFAAMALLLRVRRRR